MGEKKIAKKKKIAENGLKTWLIVMGVLIGMGVIGFAGAMIGMNGVQKSNDESTGKSDTATKEHVITGADRKAIDNIGDVVSAIIQYQTNNRGKLPSLAATCGDIACEENVTGGGTEAGKYYDNYIGEMGDANGYRVMLNFYASPKNVAYENLGMTPQSVISVFYRATCEDGNTMIASESARRVAVVVGSSDKTTYYCASN